MEATGLKYMKSPCVRKFSKPRVLIFLLTPIVFAVMAAQVRAYEEDTHFLMTYVICRSAGLTDKEALTVAAVDQGMDDSKALKVFDRDNKILSAINLKLPEQWLWHAIARRDAMTVADVVARRDALFEEAVNERDKRNRLIRLGVFFHFQQDMWAHRLHEEANHLSATKYTPVTTPDGHALWFQQPDRPPYDPVAALLSLEEGITHAVNFVRSGLGRQPNVFFRDYKPSGGSIDQSWNDARKSRYFNQISVAGLEKGSPRLFMASLIRAQIDAYTAGNRNPPYFLFSTANRADLAVSKQLIEKVCKDFKKSLGSIRLPTQAQKLKEGFDSMTTPELEDLRPGSLGRR